MQISLFSLAAFLLANIHCSSAEVPGGIGSDTTPPTVLQFSSAKYADDGTLELVTDWSGLGSVSIQSSTNLETWTNEGLWPANGPIRLPDNSRRGSQRFYRAAVFLVTVQGTIRDLATDHPVPNAKVTLSFTESWLQPNMIVHTDAQGEYRFIAPRERVINQIVVEKEGYDRLTYNRPGTATLTLNLPLWLRPPGYRPPNDDFTNRIRFEGTNITIAARTFAATSEPGHSMHIMFDDYVLIYPFNLWWSWTAPADGAVFIDAPHLKSGVLVYTGQSLSNLVKVWDTYDHDDAFFVQQGVEYQIAFGTDRPADTAFSLTMVDPRPPTGARAQFSGPFPATPGVDHGGAGTVPLGSWLLLEAASNGTSPLQFQWRKDGIDIPEATSRLFRITGVKFDDTGAYSVQIYNQAGSVITKDLHVTVVEKPQN